MLVRLKFWVTKSISYDPPIPVSRNFQEHDPNQSKQDQVTGLLWIPAFLVSRVIYQFPYLKSEADELFSIGLLKLVELVDEAAVSGEQMDSKAMSVCLYWMEHYCNNLNSPMSIGTTTRYRNLRGGDPVPKRIAMTPGLNEPGAVSDMTEIIVSDAVKALGIDLSIAPLSEKRAIAKSLGLTY